MVDQDGKSPAQAQPQRLRFDRYVLDLDRGSLYLENNEIALRPKTFAVLRHLVENPGRLVAKEELFATVWPSLAVTDDALVQSIGELRRAFGDDGLRLIKTIPRRGYRFESEVSHDISVAAYFTHNLPTESDPVSAELRGVTEQLHPVSKARIPLFFFKGALDGQRLGLLAVCALVVMLVVAALWGNLATDWGVLGVLRHGDQVAIKRSGIDARPTIAVLPLSNQSDDASREYFAEGLTQDIINALGRFSELTVMSWNAVFPYKVKPASPEEIGRGLAVAYLVEGSVRQVGDRVRVSAQLVDTRGGRVLWSSRFDEALADVFALQDKMTADIVGALAVRVTQIEQRRVFAKPTESLEAYDYVLRARPALQRPTRSNNVQARTLLKHATELDPSYAAAYAALSETFFIAASMGWAESPSEFLGRAEELAIKALSLNDYEVRARIVLGHVHLFHQRYKEAEEEIERAISMNPNDAHGLAGRGTILVWSGETDAAIDTLERAQRIDPELSAVDRFALSLAYYLKGRYDAAIEQAELNLRTTASANFSRVLLAAAYAEDNRADDAARVVTMIRRLDPTFDPQTFGSKFLKASDLEHLRDGFRKAGLSAREADHELPPNTNARERSTNSDSPW
jgi:TolB-like protein/DNA-binding winged helix-turn-helix (wHTH) protein/cytochrome c-type biogenesis protein CcmH/NrfG